MGFVGEYIVRNVTMTAEYPLDYPSEDARVATSRILLAQGTTSAVASLFGIGAFAMLTFLLFKAKGRPQGQRVVFLMLYWHVIFMTINSLFIFGFSVVKTPLETSWAICSWAGTIPSTTYVAGNGLSYAIFLKRAGAAVFVAKRSKFASRLWLFAILGTYGIPGFIGVMWLLIHGRIIYGEVCYQDHPWWLALIFTTIDTSLSLAFLYLFLEPVLQQLKLLHSGMSSFSAEPSSSQRIRATAAKNLRWSSVAIASTFAFMLAVSIIPQIGTTSETRQFRMLTWVAQPVDSLITMVSMLAITSKVWAPQTKNGGPLASTAAISRSSKGSWAQGTRARNSSVDR